MRKITIIIEDTADYPRIVPFTIEPPFRPMPSYPRPDYYWPDRTDWEIDWTPPQSPTCAPNFWQFK